MSSLLKLTLFADKMSNSLSDYNERKLQNIMSVELKNVYLNAGK